jgi:hypothetical protein
MTREMREAGVCEPVFPEADEYPAYRIDRPVLVMRPRKLEEIDLLLRRAARETGTVLV